MTRFAAEVVPSPKAIADLTDKVVRFLEGAGVDAHAVHHTALVIDEILTNVASYGGNSTAAASLDLEIQPGWVAGRIGDCGMPFDLRTAAAPDMGASVEDRKSGGLGIHLVRRLTSSLEYRRDGEQNWTTFRVLRNKQQGD